MGWKTLKEHYHIEHTVQVTIGASNWERFPEGKRRSQLWEDTALLTCHKRRILIIAPLLCEGSLLEDAFKWTSSPQVSASSVGILVLFREASFDARRSFPENAEKMNMASSGRELEGQVVLDLRATRCEVMSARL
jgi:hypothetical protein